MSLVDFGKRLLEAAKRGDTDDVRTLMSNGAPFTTDWVSIHGRNSRAHLKMNSPQQTVCIAEAKQNQWSYTNSLCCEGIQQQALASTGTKLTFWVNIDYSITNE